MQPLTDKEREKLLTSLNRAAKDSGWLVCEQAADEIERLLAEVRKLKDELDLVRRDEERFIYD